MATLVFAVASGTGGSLAGVGTLTQFALGAAATAVDSLVIFPALTRQQPPQGNRLNDLEIQNTQEAAPVNRLFGGTCRVGGTLLWQSPLREVEDTQAGGKGGSGASFIRYRYYRDVAIEICRLKRGRTIKGVKHVFADGKPFYGPLAALSNSSNKITAENRFTDENELDDTTPTRRATEELILVSDEAAGGPDLTKYQTGRNLVISGFTSTHALTGGLLKIAANAAAAAFQIQIKCFGVGVLSRNDTIVIQNDTGTYRIMDNYTFNGSLSFPETKTVDIRRIDTASLGLQSSVVTDELVTPTSGATANNGTFKPYSRGRRDATHSFVAFKTNNSVYSQLTPRFAGKSPTSETISLSQEDTAFSKTQAGDVRFYHGSRTQLQDPTIVEHEGPVVGATNVLAYRGIAYMVVEDLEVTDFGNRTPNFQFVVEVDSDDTMVTALGELFQDAGLSQAEYTLARIPADLKLAGYPLRGPQSIRVALQPVLLAYSLTSQQEGGAVELLPRTATSLVSVTGKTVAFAPGSESPRPVRVRETGDEGTQQYSVIKYIDPAINWQTASAKADGAVVVSGQPSIFETEMTLTKNDAQKLINTLWELGRISARRAAQFDLPPSYLVSAKESTRVSLTAFGQDWEFILTRVEEGGNGVLACEGVEEDLEAFNQAGIVGEGAQALTVPTGGAQAPRPSQSAPVLDARMLNLPPLRDEHVNVPGWYLAVTSGLTGVPWRGYALFESWTEDSGYAKVGEFPSRATVGRLLSLPLGYPEVDHRFIDYASSFLVEMCHPDDTLEIVLEEDMLRGRNLFLLGTEIVGVATAELVSTDEFTGLKTYRCSTLLRGLKDTFDQMSRHAVGEQVIQLDSGGLYFVSHAASRINEARFLKVVAGGGFVADALPMEFAPEGLTVLPFSPLSFVATRDGSNNLTIAWERQVRKSVQTVAQGEPLLEDKEQYRLQLFGSTTSITVLREDVLTARVWSISAATQSIYGLTPGNPVTIEVAQYSAVMQDGKTVRITL